MIAILQVFLYRLVLHIYYTETNTGRELDQLKALRVYSSCDTDSNLTSKSQKQAQIYQNGKKNKSLS